MRKMVKSRRTLIPMALALLCAVSPIQAQTDESRAGDPGLDGFLQVVDTLVPSLLEESMTASAAVALIRDGQIAWTGGFGYADEEAGRRATPQTVYNIGSISKTVAAWGAMKLVEEGKLELDAPAERYLSRWQLPPSEFDNSGVTIRRLLSHTAGLSLHGYPGFEPGEKLPTIEESLSGATNGPGDVRVTMQPGTQWSYSGGGYTILQLIVEEVTGERFADYMRSRVLRPLGMASSDYGWTPAIDRLAATPYNALGEPIGGPRFTALAAAGLQVSLEDLARFAVAGLPSYSTSPTLLKPQTIALMESPAPASPDYGLGYSISSSQGVTFVGHGGANEGWMAAFRIVPETGDGVVVLTNSSTGFMVNGPLLCAWGRWVAGATAEEPCRRSVAGIVLGVILTEGIDAAVERYYFLRRTAPYLYDFREFQLNNVGYQLLQAGRAHDAIEIFGLNVWAYPDAFNTYDSLGEAYMINGDIERAIANYERSLELNPDNTNAVEMLERLRRQ